MLHPEDFFRAGFIQKTFGVKGEVICLLDQESMAFDLRKKEPLFLLLEGNWVPFFIDAIQSLSNTELRIKLEDINTPEQAANYLSLPVFLPLSLLENPEKHPELLEIKGFKILNNQAEMIGTVKDIHSIKAQKTLSVISEKSQIVYIPLVEEYIISVDIQEKSIQMEIPEGLMDLNA